MLAHSAQERRSGGKALAVLCFLLAFSAGPVAIAGTTAAPLAKSDGLTGSDKLMLGCLLATAIMLAIVGGGIMMCLFGVFVLVVLFWVGFLAPSVITGIVTRKPSKAVRVLVIQFLGVCGVPVGMFLFWLAVRLFQFGVPTGWVLLVGGAAGAAGGVLLAVLGLRLATPILKRLVGAR